MSDRVTISRTLKSLFDDRNIEHEPFYLESVVLTIEDFVSTKLKHTCDEHASNIAPWHFASFLSGESSLSAVCRFHRDRNGVFDGPFPTLSQCQQWLEAFPLQDMAFNHDSSAPQQSKGRHVLDEIQSQNLLIPLTLWPKENGDRLEIARLLLRNKGCDPNGTSPRGWEAFCWQPTDMGMAPLHFAVPLGDAPMVKLLLEFGADPMKQDGYGRVPGSVPHLKGVGDEGFKAWIEGGGKAVKAWLKTDAGKKASEHYKYPTAERDPDGEDQIRALINSGYISATGPSRRPGKSRRQKKKEGELIRHEEALRKGRYVVLHKETI